MKNLRQFLLVFLVAFITASLVSGTVRAATSAFEIVSCKSDGSVNNSSQDGKTGFFDISKIVTEDCKSLDETRIFSSIVCNFVSILNQVLSVTYCGLQHSLMPVLSIILTLYICLFGAQVLMGMVQLTGGEILMRLIKIGVIWAFASQGSWGVGMLYKFFIGFTLQGIDWVLGAIPPCVIKILCSTTTGTDIGAGTPASSVFQQIDSQLYGIIAGFETGAGKAVGGLFSGKQELVSFFLALSVIAFSLFLLVLSLLWMTVKIFARTMISLLMGIAAVAFLIAVSPIFLSCMLYKTTSKLFESWLKYIVAYSLQPVITFAILALWLTVASQFMGFMADLSSTLSFRDKTGEQAVNVTPEHEIGFCELSYSTTANGPSIQCKDGVDKDSIDKTKLIPPTLMIKDNKFLYFLTYHLVTLLVVGFAFSTILEQAPSISQMLAGSNSATALGQNFASGLGNIGDLFKFGGGGGGGGGGGLVSQFTGAARRAQRRRT